MEKNEEKWRPKPGDTVVYRAKFKSRGLTPQSRRVIVDKVHPSGFCQIKLGPGWFKNVKIETLYQLE